MRVSIFIFALAWAGCGTSIDIPDGVFACSTAADCPTDFECRADGLCYAPADAEIMDAAADAVVDGGADGAVDASMDGGG